MIVEEELGEGLGSMFGMREREGGEAASCNLPVS